MSARPAGPLALLTRCAMEARRNKRREERRIMAHVPGIKKNRKRQLFGTDGVRGVANLEPMTSEMALKLGRAVARVLREPAPDTGGSQRKGLSPLFPRSR